MESVSLYSEARNEYLKQMATWVVPPLVEFFRKEFQGIALREGKKAMTVFQTWCSEVPRWNQDVIEANVNSLLDSCRCDYVEELMTAVFIAHTKMLTAIRVNTRQKKLQITLPKLDHFLHRVFVECARAFWKAPFLFVDTVSLIDMQKNVLHAESMCTEALSGAVRSLLPVKSILRDNLEEDASSSEEDEPVERKKKTGATFKKAGAGALGTPISELKSSVPVPMEEESQDDDDEEVLEDVGNNEDIEGVEEVEEVEEVEAFQRAEDVVNTSVPVTPVVPVAPAPAPPAPAPPVVPVAPAPPAPPAPAPPVVSAAPAPPAPAPVPSTPVVSAAPVDPVPMPVAPAPPAPPAPWTEQEALTTEKTVTTNGTVNQVHLVKEEPVLQPSAVASPQEFIIDTEPSVHFTPYDTVYDENTPNVSEIRYAPKRSIEDMPPSSWYEDDDEGMPLPKIGIQEESTGSLSDLDIEDLNPHSSRTAYAADTEDEDQPIDLMGDDFEMLG